MNHVTRAERDRERQTAEQGRTTGYSGARSGSPLIFTLLAMQAEGYPAAGLRDLALRAMPQAAMRTPHPRILIRMLWLEYSPKSR
ncbi:hypothetical protein FIBSPDRAFT_866994 [Athelia psychrophila]|uniref:Uncharacterized protein n=1 Tax=Athelia psychrophila TaxID=1759441 RepID=A0A166EBH5_9AGAM|nr:hypothetical protein FIBSPDRAFT_866994 [Fibularhizoctonia sp. CBS 109695]